ncbi:hypothetical protein V9T40_008904 [Parthenolecanium corni]
MKLNYDKQTGRTSNRHGIHTRISEFGSIDKFAYLDSTKLFIPYYTDLINRLIEEDYIPGLSLKAAPYDFRKAPYEQMDYIRDLKNLIEKTYEENGEKKVVLIVNSLGGLMSLIFLRRQSTEWKDKYIQYVISVAVGWAGSVKAVEAYVRGFSIGTAEFSRACSRFSAQPLTEQPREYAKLPQILLLPKSLLRTMPSIIWLFPSSKAWEKTDVLVRLRNKTYTLNNMEEFFTDLEEPNGWEMYQDIKSFQDEVSEPGVELHCLYATDIQTVALVDYSFSFFDYWKKQLNSDGDGTANLQSLQVCEKWKTETNKVKTKSFPGLSHVEMIKNSEVLDHIIDIIDNN